MSFERYAIYFCPEFGSALEEFGEHWFGRDAYGQTVSRQYMKENQLFLDESDLQPLIEGAARYGFHGTLKAPFRLESDHPRHLKDAIDQFTRNFKVVTAPPLKLTNMGTFLALCPSGIAGPNDEIDHLARNCVREFDHFRAPLSDRDLQRRNPELLSASQRESLQQWGYPYIFDDFRFHISLTGALSEAQRAKATESLLPLLEVFADQPFIISSLCLFGDPGNNKPFRMIERYPLQG